MEIVERRKIYFAVSLALLLTGLLSLLFWGLRLGIDFTGGSLMEVEFPETRLTSDEIKDKLEGLDLGQVSLQPTGARGLILRFKDVDETVHRQILEKLGLGTADEIRFESIGPLIGAELKRKALWAILLALLAIVLYIAWSFRKVSKPVASWQYGLIAVTALFHDIFITLGFFSILTHFREVEIGLPFVAAFLTILGYSVNNSIVIFDRVRENLLKTNWEYFAGAVNDSINQSLTRCLNTALTTLFVLLAIFFLGGETIRYFALALIVGIIVGTYSSVFITSPLLVVWEGWKRRS